MGWIGIGIAGLTTLACALGLAVMWLWNWLMPVLFGLPVLTFPQAIGLLVLCHLLFRGHSLGHRARHFGPRGRDRRAEFLRRLHVHLESPAERDAATGDSAS